MFGINLSQNAAVVVLLLTFGPLFGLPVEAGQRLVWNVAAHRWATFHSVSSVVITSLDLSDLLVQVVLGWAFVVVKSKLRVLSVLVRLVIWHFFQVILRQLSLLSNRRKQFWRISTQRFLDFFYSRQPTKTHNFFFYCNLRHYFRYLLPALGLLFILALVFQNRIRRFLRKQLNSHPLVVKLQLRLLLGLATERRQLRHVC